MHRGSEAVNISHEAASEPTNQNINVAGSRVRETDEVQTAFGYPATVQAWISSIMLCPCNL